jgi:hypothetical protein
MENFKFYKISIILKAVRSLVSDLLRSTGFMHIECIFGVIDDKRETGLFIR